MTLVGLQIGRAVAGFVRIRSDLLTGVALVVMAVAIALGFSDQSSSSRPS